MAGEHTFNFAQLDAVAADLDLGIDAAEEIEVAIGQQPHHVAAAEEARAGTPAEWVGHKFGSCDTFGEGPEHGGVSAKRAVLVVNQLAASAAFIPSDPVRRGGFQDDRELLVP